MCAKYSTKFVVQIADSCSRHIRPSVTQTWRILQAAGAVLRCGQWRGGDECGGKLAGVWCARPPPRGRHQ